MKVASAFVCRHTLAVEIVGANEKAIKSYMFGLDQFILDPAR